MGHHTATTQRLRQPATAITDSNAKLVFRIDMCGFGAVRKKSKQKEKHRHKQLQVIEEAGCLSKQSPHQIMCYYSSREGLDFC